jgi:DNA-binding transcriptional ArsR family regulator
MVNLQAAALDDVFYALSDATRRTILEMVGGKARTITELAEPFRMSLAAVSKHVKVLERARLIRRRVEGRVHWCELDRAALATAEEAIRYYRKFWENRLDALSLHLEAEEKREKKEKSHVRRRK